MKLFCNLLAIRYSDAIVYQTAMHTHNYSILEKNIHSYIVWIVANVDYNVGYDYNAWLMIDDGYY